LLQALPLLHRCAFLDENVADDSSFQRLNHLDLSGGYDLSVAALDFLQDREMGPNEKGRKEGNESPEQHSGSLRRAQACRGADVVCVGKVS
jgi:hypothetical protein